MLVWRWTSRLREPANAHVGTGVSPVGPSAARHGFCFVHSSRLAAQFVSPPRKRWEREPRHVQAPVRGGTQFSPTKWRGFLRLDDFAAAQAGGAHADAPGRAAHLGADRPQVDVPAPLAHVVGVADIVAELRPLATDITNLCHDFSRRAQNLISRDRKSTRLNSSHRCISYAVFCLKKKNI